MALYEFDLFTLLDKHSPLLPHSLSLLPKGVWIILSKQNTMTEYRCYFDDCLHVVLQCRPELSNWNEMSWLENKFLDYPAISRMFHSSEARGCFQGTFLALKEQDYYYRDRDGRTQPTSCSCYGNTPFKSLDPNYHTSKHIKTVPTVAE